MPSKLSPAIPEPQAGYNLPPSTLSLGIESQALDPCPRPKSYPFSYGQNGKSRLPDACLEGELDGHTPSAICGWIEVPIKASERRQTWEQGPEPFSWRGRIE